MQIALGGATIDRCRGRRPRHRRRDRGERDRRRRRRGAVRLRDARHRPRPRRPTRAGQLRRRHASTGARSATTATPPAATAAAPPVSSSPAATRAPASPAFPGRGGRHRPGHRRAARIRSTSPRRALDPRRLFVVEQEGRIRIIKDGTLLDDPFLAIEERVSCCGERGLLGLAFHPDYETNGRFFVNYTEQQRRHGDRALPGQRRSRPRRPRQRADRCSPSTSRSPTTTAARSPSGRTAISTSAWATAAAAAIRRRTRRTTTRCSASCCASTSTSTSGPTTRVPPTTRTPSAASRLGLIWAKGLRNPWRFSFDRATGDLYIADVGQGDIEEIDVQPAASRGGENYGWDIFEGSACFEPDPFPDLSRPAGRLRRSRCSSTRTPAAAARSPAATSTAAAPCPICAAQYFFADYCTPFLQSLPAGRRRGHRPAGPHRCPGTRRRPSASTTSSSFGEDARGELYIADYDGEVYKIVPTP